MRLCHTVGVLTEIELKNNRIITKSESVEIHRNPIEFALGLANVTELTVVRQNSDCVERFINNQSDFSPGYFYMHDETGQFYVPVPAIATSLHILTGYNVYEYEQNGTNITTKYGIIHNFNSFSWQIYFLVVLWLLSLYCIIGLSVNLIKSKFKLIRRVKYSFSLFYLVFRGKTKRWRTISLIINIARLLLVTPFCILFKTNQVVIKKPHLLNTYNEIIKNNAQMYYTTYYMNDSLFLKNAAGNDGPVSDKEVWNYFESHAHEFIAGKSLKSLQLIKTLAKEITKQESVFIGSFAVTEILRQTFCSFSDEPNLYQILTFHDSRQGEIISGFAFREENQPKNLIRKIRSFFEANIPEHWLSSIRVYPGFRFFPQSTEHRQQQLALCTRDELAEYRKDEKLTSSFYFYYHFFQLTIFLFAFSFIVVMIENFILIIYYC